MATIAAQYKDTRALINIKISISLCRSQSERPAYVLSRSAKVLRTPASSPQDDESPFENALALVAQLEKQMQGKPKRISGVNDATTEPRQLREELTPELHS